MPRPARLPVLVPLLSFAVLLLHFVPGAASLLEYRAAAVGSGEIWRLFTWHLAHWHGRHLLWDLAVFTVLGTAAELHSARLVAWTLGAGVLAVSAAVLLAHPELPSCRGLSGVDCALFALLWSQALRQARADGDGRRVLLLAAACVGFLGKTAYELAGGQALFAGDGFVPLPVAHLAGFAAGLAVAVGHGLCRQETGTGSSGCAPDPSQTRDCRRGLDMGGIRRDAGQ